jgi:hypothetical protein
MVTYCSGMGYEIGFLAPGQDDGDLADERLPLQLTDGQETAWQRIVSRTRQEICVAEESRYPTHLELWLKDPAMQLWYEGASASIEVPYWYTATAAGAQSAIATAYALARIVEDETGMPGVDHEVDQRVQQDGVPQATAQYRGVGQHVRALVEGRAPQPGHVADGNLGKS